MREIRRSAKTAMLVIAAVATLLALAGCAGSDEPSQPTENAGDFYKRRLTYDFKRQFGRSWDMLHPAHQKLVSRSRYASCEDERFPIAQLRKVVVLGIKDAPLDVANIPQKTAKRITLKVTVGIGKQQVSLDRSYHAVDVDGAWRWMLDDGAIAAFRRGLCAP
jgi:hypothetical protein